MQSKVQVKVNLDVFTVFIMHFSLNVSWPFLTSNINNTHIDFVSFFFKIVWLVSISPLMHFLPFNCSMNGLIQQQKTKQIIFWDIKKYGIKSYRRCNIHIYRETKGHKMQDKINITNLNKNVERNN